MVCCLYKIICYFYRHHIVLLFVCPTGMNIPMYGAVKRCTPLVNLVLSVVILHRPFPSCTLISSILIITSGCFVAGESYLIFCLFKYFHLSSKVPVVASGVRLIIVIAFCENGCDD